MRVVKAFLGALVAAALIAMWAERHTVIDAYRNEGRTSTEVQLDGVDLTFELTPIQPSPYEVVASPDTRRVAVADVFSAEVELVTEPPSDDTAAGDDSAADGDTGSSGGEPAPAPPRPSTPEVEPVAVYGGTAQLRGVVKGPDGAVPFATIRLERHTRNGSATEDVVADRNGRWAASRLHGGRYRVWSWAAEDDLATPSSTVFFLDDETTRPTDLALEQLEAEPRVTLADGGDIYVGLSGTVAVAITAQRVDEDGRVGTVGLPGTVVVFEPSSGVTASPAVAVTDDDGVARFTLHCESVGSPFVHVRHSADVKQQPSDPDRIHPFTLPACVPIPPPTTQPPATTPPAPGTQPAAGAPAAAAPPTTRPSSPPGGGTSSGGPAGG